MSKSHFKHPHRMKLSRYWRLFKLLFILILGFIIYALITLYLIPSSSLAKPYKTSWIGNTFGGGSQWVQNFVEALYVMPDGKVYTNSVWDEAGREAGIYKNGKAVGMLSELHGWGRGGGVAVTVHGKYVYAAMTQGSEGGGLKGDGYPPKDITWYCIRRYHLNGKPAPFSGGKGQDRSMAIVSTAGPITGLAAVGNELYVSDSAANRIRVYDTKTMTQVRNWSVSQPGQIAADRQGNLWVIQATTGSKKPQILHYSKTGKQLSAKIPDVVEPTALAIDKQGRLLVTENGPRQQVLIYSIAGRPKLIGTFGTKGGIYADTRGEMGNTKLYGLTGVGTDAVGNFYVSSNGFKDSGTDFSGTDLRGFTSSGKLRWQLLGLPFVDNADADPGTDGKDVFTKHEHFVMDYRQDSGKEWSYKAYTIDRFRYPDDPRLHNQGHSTASVFIRRLAGKRMMYVLGMFANRMAIYRFDGEIAVPCGMIARNQTKDWPDNQPVKTSWMWRDRNGDGAIQPNEYESLGAEDDTFWGWEVDSKGDIWQASESGKIRRYRYQGLDSYGSPIYSSSAVGETQMPSPFDKLERIKYFPDTDVMYLAGYTKERPQTGKEWGIVGTEIVRYDNWSKNRKQRWRIALPYEPDGKPIERFIKAMDITKDRIFAVVLKTAEVYVYDTAKGKYITKLTPGAEVARESGWVDIPYGLRAYRKSNGEYLVFVEEDLKAKVLMYRLPSSKLTALFHPVDPT